MSPGGRPGLSVLTSLLVSVDVNHIEPCFGTGLSLYLICQPISEYIKQHNSSNQCVSMVQYYFTSTETIKPVLNWANVCSPNVLQTVRRTMIRFLIELLVRRSWFGQRRTLLRSQLACNEMQTSARTCGRRAADSMIQNGS